jgi:hypothetical protein
MAGVGLGISGALAIGGLALSAIGTGASFAQAGKQNRLRRSAEDEAAKSMAAAEKILETNYLKGISLPKEAYEREREALLASGAQALQAGAEGSTRGAAATAGRVQMAQQAGQRNIATAQADRLLELELMGAKEDSRLQAGLADLEMMGVVGAQQAARDAQMAQQRAVQQGFQGLTKMGKTAVDYKNELIPLFSRNKNASVPSTQISDFSSFGLDSLSSLNMPALGMSDVQNFQQFINPAVPANTTIASPIDIYNPANYTNPLTQ